MTFSFSERLCGRRNELARRAACAYSIRATRARARRSSRPTSLPAADDHLLSAASLPSPKPQGNSIFFPLSMSLPWKPSSTSAKSVLSCRLPLDAVSSPAVATPKADRPGSGTPFAHRRPPPPKTF